jgi:hypothetical protein
LIANDLEIFNPNETKNNDTQAKTSVMSKSLHSLNLPSFHWAGYTEQSEQAQKPMKLNENKELPKK